MIEDYQSKVRIRGLVSNETPWFRVGGELKHENVILEELTIVKSPP